MAGPRSARYVQMTEQAALGEAMLHPTDTARAVATLRSEHFTVPAHGEIFDAIAALHSYGAPCDPVAVAGYLHQSPTWGDGRCSSYLEKAVELAAANFDGDCIADVAVAAFARQLEAIR